MNRVRSLALLYLFLLAVTQSGMTQAERLKTSASLHAQTERHVRPQEHVRLVFNQVETIARHCQKYAAKKTGRIDSQACAEDPGTIFYREVSHNLRTHAGADAQASQMGNTSTQAAACNYIGLTNNSTAPAATDTTLAGEITSNGLSRTQGAYAHTSGTAAYTISKTFTATGTQASQKSGLFNAASSGTMCFENTYTAVTINSGDTLTITWTINY